MRKISSALLLSGTAAIALTSCTQKADSKKNLLLVFVDDLRPELNCYGHDEIVSPNIDALAGQGTLFTRAYCNIAVSGASRACILTGTRPTRHTFFAADTYASGQKPDKTVLNTFLQENGYFTMLGHGKVFHHRTDHIDGWDIAGERFSGMKYLDPKNLIPRNDGRRGRPYECLEVEDTCYADGRIAEAAIEDLRLLAAQEKPFFYALGFCRPHLPFNAPKKYWDLYNREDIVLPSNYYMEDGHGIPEAAFPKWGELRNKYVGVPGGNELVGEELAKTLIHGYRACVSFTDAQIGKVMDEFRRLGLDKNTVVVLIGDHGWNLGEHGTWCKHSIMETSLHTPMIIVDPQAKLRGHKCSEVVEFVDIFPTICDMLGLEAPQQLEGESLHQLLNDPDAESSGWGISRWNDGFTLITDDNLFYTEWWDEDDNIKERLLFDHNIDPDENINLAGREEYAERIKELSIQLKERRGKEFDKYPNP